MTTLAVDNMVDALDVKLAEAFGGASSARIW